MKATLSSSSSTTPTFSTKPTTSSTHGLRMRPDGGMKMGLTDGLLAREIS